MNLLSLKKASRTLLLVCCLGFALRASGNDAGRFLRLGDAAYTRRAFDSAVTYYGQAASGTMPDAVALVKLGNAHYRLRHIGEAMLCYERALMRRPGFAVAAGNARAIQRQVRPGSDKEIFFLHWWRALTAPGLSNLWAVLAVLLFAAVTGALAWRAYSRKNTLWLRTQAVAAAFLIAALFAAFALAGVLRDVPHSRAVVMRPDTKFRPVAGAAKGGGLSLPEGLLIQVLHVKADEITVSLPDGQEGFVQRTDIAIVE